MNLYDITILDFHAFSFFNVFRLIWVSTNLPFIRYFTDDHLHQCLLQERLAVNFAKGRIHSIKE